MCIIASSEIGKNLPTTETIETMWRRNSDGAGFMYNHNGKVIIEKGFMKLKDFLAAIENLKTKIDVVNTTVIMHFRIGTHGGNTPENTHPFPITHSEQLLKKLHTSCDIGMAHNGIIASVKPRNNISDTMEYVLEILAPLKKTVKSFNSNPVIQKLIAETINGSRMCFLTPDGNVNYIGDWKTDEETGIKYSNNTYVSYDEWDFWGKYNTRTKKYSYMDEINPSWVLASPIDGYAINTKTGDMYDATEEELYIDEDSNVYMYMFSSDIAIRLSDTVAYNVSGLPAKFDESQAFDINWVFEEEFDDYEDYLYFNDADNDNDEDEAVIINKPIKLNEVNIEFN